MKKNKNLQPTIISIFGGSGDLTNRKLIPALYNLFLSDQMPEKFAIIGLGRSEFSDEKFRNHLRKGLDEFSRSGKVKKETWESFRDNIFYMVSDVFDDKSYQNLGKKLIPSVKNGAKKPTRFTISRSLPTSSSRWPGVWAGINFVLIRKIRES